MYIAAVNEAVNDLESSIRVVVFELPDRTAIDATARLVTGQMTEEEDLSSLNWLRGFPSVCAHVTATLTQNGGAVLRSADSDTDGHDTDNNNHIGEMTGLDTAQRNELLLRKLGDEQSQMKSTLVAFRQWASDATRALRTLTARAESAERKAAANQSEVLRLQAVIAKQTKEYNRTNGKKRSRQDLAGEPENPESLEDPEEEGSSGEDSRGNAIADRIISRCESGRNAPGPGPTGGLAEAPNNE